MKKLLLTLLMLVMATAAMSAQDELEQTPDPVFTIEEGENYRFTKSADADNYTYGDVTYRMNWGDPIPITPNADGVYTMEITPVEGATYDINFSKDGYVAQTLEDVDLENVPEVVVLEADAPQAISTINTSNAVSVQYIDAMGRVSDRPFKGVNIVVTRNADGTTTTAKVVK